MKVVLYTIGHSNHELWRLTELLCRYAVTHIADVRSSPYSAYNPQFNRERLQAHLATSGIGYVFLGAELGARRCELECYDDDGRVRYDRVAQVQGFQAGLERLADIWTGQRVSLLCAEKDPLNCHRMILVCRALRERALDIRHIRDDGTFESHDAAESRLLALCRLPERDLFRSRDELIAEAYDRQAARIAYVLNQREAISVS